MSTPTFYNPGTEVSIPFTVLDGNGAATDPASIKFHYHDAAGTSYTKVYGTDTDVVSKTAVGHYTLLIYVPYTNDSAGEWPYDAQALDGSGNSLLVETQDPPFFVVNWLRSMV